MGGSPAARVLSRRELLALAREAALSAGALLLEASRGPAEGVQSKSTPTDLVSEADLAAERAIRELLAARRPGDRLLGEEGGEAPLGDGEPTGVRWIVDPLDGTVNFLFGLPQWCVSVAAEDSDGALLGVVHDPSRGETFTATRDGPAMLDDRAVRGSRRDDLADGAGRDRLRVRRERARAPVPDRRSGAAARARHPAPRQRGARPVLDGLWPLRRLLRARPEPVGRRGGRLICDRAGLAVRRLEPDDDLPGGLAVAPEAAHRRAARARRAVQCGGRDSNPHALSGNGF